MRKTLLVASLIGAPIVIGDQVINPAEVAKTTQADPRLQVLWQFFADRDCPLQDSVADFLVAADQNELDWRLLPSISMIESSGGKDYRNNNVLGWDSCRESFPSVQAGIHFVARRLAESRLYKNKSLDEKLLTYNPQPEYSMRVKAVMRKLDAGNHPGQAVN